MITDNWFHSVFVTAYSVFFIMGLLFSMQVPFVGFQPVRTSEHMAAAGMMPLATCNLRDYKNAHIFLNDLFHFINTFTISLMIIRCPLLQNLLPKSLQTWKVKLKTQLYGWIDIE